MERIIREANENDLEQIVNISKNIFPYEYKDKQEQSHCFIQEKLEKVFDKIYVVCIGEEVLGYAIYGAKGLTGTHELFQLGIKKQCQGKGIGTILLGESINKYVKYIKDQSLPIFTIYLTTSSDNPAGQNLYHKLGFVKTGEIKDTFLGEGNIEIVMTKFLDNRKYPINLWNKNKK